MNLNIRLHVAAAILLVVAQSHSSVVQAEPAATENLAARAPVFRGDAPVQAQADGAIVAEAEEFHVAAPGTSGGSGGWQAKNWGENYYAATFANTFLSRKAFLGAPPQCEKQEASVTVNVPKAGKYLALVRYEAAYRFETQFKLRITQGGATKLDRLYGARDNVKVWAFKGQANNALQKEVCWGWGAVENVVWEGHDAAVELAAGPATLTLVADKQPDPAAKRNVDLVLLTPNIDNVQKRIATEGYLPLDGLLTQEGDVFLRVTNRGATAMTLTAPPCTQHSPYWVHQRTWQARTITVQPGQTSDWHEVGGVLDSLNDGQWALSASAGSGAALDYKVEFALKSAAGAVEPIASFDSKAATLELAYDANTRYTRRVRLIDNVLYDLVDYLHKHPVPGEAPKRTVVNCYTFAPKPGDAKYNAARDEFMKMYPLVVDAGGLTPSGAPAGAIDVRSVATDKLEAHLRGLGTDLKSIRTVSMGDEIGLATPPAGAATDTAYRAWGQAQKLQPADLDPNAGNDWSKVTFALPPDAATASPRRFYYGHLFAFNYGIQDIKARTDIIKRVLPNADTGANFSPHAGAAFLGGAFQWITLFRRGGMTMPWGEDYVWQIPIGSQQMNFLCLDLFRAGIRYKPEEVIQYYVMPHTPGNTTASWRRQFYGDLGHGMKIVNLFEFEPVQVAYTENHCSDPEMYLEVKRSLHEMAKFEDIIQDGHVRHGDAALWYSRAGDVWDNDRPPFGAGKRTLYIAAKHQQLQLDIVDEEDALAGTLTGYKVLYLTDQNVSVAASKAIVKWVYAGGHLFTTAGAGMKDEFNQPNQVMEELLGVKQTGLEIDPKTVIKLEKQDLPFAGEMDKVTYDLMKVTVGPFAWSGSDPRAIPVSVVGGRSKITVSGADVAGKFSDGSPAVTTAKAGRGTATYVAFFPGLSYFKPAIPKRPVDRGSTDDAMSHFVPTEFDAFGAGNLCGASAGMVPRVVICSTPLVEADIIESKYGRVIPLTNWSKGPIKGLTVTVSIDVPTKKVELASSGKVKVEKKNGEVIFTFDLDVADALILR